MPFEIIRNDITKVKVEAIVNTANSSLLGGGGVDGAIHRAAGPDLLNECRKLNGCNTGQAKITKGYNLPAKYVIHTVGPVWYGGNNNEESNLKSCYTNSLNLAKDYNLENIAFPLISSGVYGYPKDEALKVATSVIKNFLLDNEMNIYLVIYDKETVLISEKLSLSIKEYIDDKYVEDKQSNRRRDLSSVRYNENVKYSLSSIQNDDISKKSSRSLDDLVDNIDDTFSEMLLRLIDQKGMTDVETYKKANIDRKLFSKIRKNVNYNPSKSTVLAFAIALELNLDETKDLLLRAGYAISHSSKFDIIIEYFIESGNYNMFEINQSLFTFEEKLLGV
jgi:O-acetyl-ADP-ribose deacetylase (regulator of RNase III)